MALSLFSTRNGNLITLNPIGVSLKIPANWVVWYSRHANNLHLSRQQLAAVEFPKNDEWDTEFARVCNVSLPFDRCVAHLGSEGWGDDARSFSDLQVRVYDLMVGSKDLEKRIVKDASSVAKPHRVPS